MFFEIMALIVIWMKMALISIGEPSSDTKNTSDLWMEQLKLKNNWSKSFEQRNSENIRLFYLDIIVTVPLNEW